MDASVSTTLQHTISFLLNPLSTHFPPQTLDALHNALLSSFSSLTVARLNQPSTHTHTFLLSPTAPAPAIIQRALHALPYHLRVQWADWILLLGNGNHVVLSIGLNPGLVTATVRNAKTGLVNFNTIWDAEQMARKRNSRISSPWGPPSIASARSRSSAASSAESELDFSSSSRSSSPDVVAVETAENVLSGVYDDDDDEDQIRFGKMASAFGGMSLLPPAAPTMVRGGRKTSLSAAAAEWFPRGVQPPQRYAQQSKACPISSTGFASAFSAGMTSTNTAPILPATTAARQLPTPIGAHRTAAAQQAGGGHSRSSSRSSTLSMGTTPSLCSAASTSASSPTQGPPSPTLSDTAGSVDLYIDVTKDQQAVTEYECGKVGVLTGAVMLGVPKNSANGSAANAWRKREQPAVALGQQQMAVRR